MSARTVIAFDYGIRRIGVAIGQELTKTATPLTTIQRRNKSSESSDIDWQPVDELVREWQPQVAVVGLPLTADGQETPVTQGAKMFGEQLQKRYNLETYWIDERLTSAEAESMIASSKPSGKSARKSQGRRGDKGEIDKLAAKIILESWFNQN
ncbi:Holliday junction resolvase RuvX [Kaarinaea lacus]